MFPAIRAGAYVLDLGSAGGTLPDEPAGLHIICVDIEKPPSAPRGFVQADGARLPFADRVFQAVICNNSLEHILSLERCLNEIKRVARVDAALYVAVPDASTITDKIYRWLGRGGGHVNPFSNPEHLAQLIQEQTGLQHRGTVTLYTSLCFLNRKNWRAPAPLRTALFGGGYEWTLILLTYILRKLDRLLGTRMSVYGWALYFGTASQKDCTGRTNVCVRCGAGHSARRLAQTGRLSRGILPAYKCPQCHTTNLFTRDES